MMVEGKGRNKGIEALKYGEWTSSSATLIDIPGLSHELTEQAILILDIALQFILLAELTNVVHVDARFM